MTDVRAEIIRRISAGESLRSVCRTEGFPSPPTVVRWTHEDKDFEAEYLAALEQRADVYFDRLDEVSDEAALVDNAPAVPGLRLKADNIKWQLARMSKRYRDKAEVEHSGGLRVTSATELKDDELAAIATASRG